MSRNEAVSITSHLILPFCLHCFVCWPRDADRNGHRCRRCASTRHLLPRPQREAAVPCQKSAPMSTAGTLPAGTRQQRYVPRPPFPPAFPLHFRRHSHLQPANI
ncbi:hypothetical protein IG631_06865 [Alternaria alternata]|nr:hypothetical protein IG631_06865 [Alternaria alternata]